MKSFYNGHPVHIEIQTLLDFNFNISPIFDKLAETVGWKLLIAVIKQNQHIPGGYNFQGVYRKAINLKIFNIHFNKRNVAKMMAELILVFFKDF